MSPNNILVGFVFLFLLGLSATSNAHDNLPFVLRPLGIDIEDSFSDEDEDEEDVVDFPDAAFNAIPTPNFAPSNDENSEEASEGDEEIQARPFKKRVRIDQTELMDAVSQNNPDLVTDILERGADVNEQNELGGTALHLAAAMGNTALIRILLDAGANPLIPNFNGESALEKARSYGFEGCVIEMERQRI